ncbi:MAG: heavy metal-binding domain-containing protein, partial [Gemmatimonadota bacterium]
MDVAPEKAAGSLDHEGTTYYFCGKGCLEKFRAEPTRYSQGSKGSKGSEGSQVGHRGVEYTCPMHPEVVQIGPGACPKCGMALEPRVASEDEGPNPELVDMTRRFWIGVVLTAPLLAIMLAELLPTNPIAGLMMSGALPWIEAALASPVVLWAGWPFFVRMWQSFVNRHLNMFTLIGIGTGAAYGYSLVATTAPGIFPASFRGRGGDVPLYFEAAAVITVLVLLGQVLELRARGQTSSAIKALLGLAPKTARRVNIDGTEADIPLSHVHVGDRLRVRPGERVPV